MEVMGTPAAKSTLECNGATTPGAHVRKGEDAVCVITIKDANDDDTTGFADDFATPTIVGGALKTNTELTSISSSTEVTFTMTPTADIGEEFSARGRLKAGNAVIGDAKTTVKVIGTPTADSILACTGK
jgi:uncharacterized Zn-binding protein involved in type VI secretion